MTQVVSGLWGGRGHGSFAGKAATGRPAHAANEVVTGLWGGRRHGTFAGKTAGVVVRPTHAPNEVVTGLWGGRRHGAFSGKELSIIAPPVIETPETVGGGYVRRKFTSYVRPRYGLLYAEDEESDLIAVMQAFLMARGR